MSPMFRAAFACGALLTVSRADVADVLEDGVREGLVADDACQSEGCGLGLLQLASRTQVEGVADAADDGKAAEELSEDSRGTAQDADVLLEETLEQTDADFGPNAVGKNMWSELTYEQAVLLDRQASSRRRSSSNSGNGSSSNGRCDADTYGSCSIQSCAVSRGATQCVSHKCLCKEGHCAQDGVCFPKPGYCQKDSGGTCSALSCSSSRGKADCKSGKCLCQEGNCAWGGTCLPATDSGGTCGYTGCKASRGSTTCHKGKCLCQAGFVARNGRCLAVTFDVDPSL